MRPDALPLAPPTFDPINLSRAVRTGKRLEPRLCEYMTLKLQAKSNAKQVTDKHAHCTYKALSKIGDLMNGYLSIISRPTASNSAKFEYFLKAYIARAMNVINSLVVATFFDLHFKLASTSGTELAGSTNFSNWSLVNCLE